MSNQVLFKLLDYCKVKTSTRVERGLLRKTFTPQPWQEDNTLSERV